jgi:hypothetical protein
MSSKFIFPRKQLEKIFKSAMDLAEKKSHDYNQSTDVIGTIGTRGIADLLFNKAARLRSLTKFESEGKEAKISSEKKVDTLIDSLNYSVYGAAIEMGEWENGKAKPTTRKPRKKKKAKRSVKKVARKKKAKKSKKVVVKKAVEVTK